MPHTSMRKRVARFARARLRRTAALLGIGVLMVAAACSRPPAADARLDDEGMQRYKADTATRKSQGRPIRTPQEAAYDWYYPKDVQNYFEGMDGVIPSDRSV